MEQSDPAQICSRGHNSQVMEGNVEQQRGPAAKVLGAEEPSSYPGPGRRLMSGALRATAPEFFCSSSCSLNHARPRPVPRSSDVICCSNGSTAGSITHSSSINSGSATAVLSAAAAETPALNSYPSLGLKQYRFYGDPACSTCGATGHVAEECSTRYCATCCCYGHPTGCCSAACSRCWKIHAKPRNTECDLCSCTFCHLWGHVAATCPSARCLRCGYYGHMVRECQELLPQPPPPAAGQRSSRSGPTAASSNPRGLTPDQIRLQTPASVAEACRRQRLLSMLHSVVPTYAASLASQPHKLQCLSRVSPEDLVAIMQLDHPTDFLDRLYHHHCGIIRCSSSSTKGDDQKQTAATAKPLPVPAEVAAAPSEYQTAAAAAVPVLPLPAQAPVTAHSYHTLTPAPILPAAPSSSVHHVVVPVASWCTPLPQHTAYAPPVTLQPAPRLLRPWPQPPRHHVGAAAAPPWLPQPQPPAAAAAVPSPPPLPPPRGGAGGATPPAPAVAAAAAPTAPAPPPTSLPPSAVAASAPPPPRQTRAVATAVAVIPVSLLIPAPSLLPAATAPADSPPPSHPADAAAERPPPPPPPPAAAAATTPLSVLGPEPPTAAGSPTNPPPAAAPSPPPATAAAAPAVAAIAATATMSAAPPLALQPAAAEAPHSPPLPCPDDAAADSSPPPLAPASPVAAAVAPTVPAARPTPPRPAAAPAAAELLPPPRPDADARPSPPPPLPVPAVPVAAAAALATATAPPASPSPAAEAAPDSLPPARPADAAATPSPPPPAPAAAPAAAASSSTAVAAADDSHELPSSSSSSSCGKSRSYFCGPVTCATCGLLGHLAEQCRVQHCSQCNQYGHTQAECGKPHVCTICGRKHVSSKQQQQQQQCQARQCKHCGLWGHVACYCPRAQCKLCGYLGHMSSECKACSICKQHGHIAEQCTAPSVAAADEVQVSNSSSREQLSPAASRQCAVEFTASTSQHEYQLQPEPADPAGLENMVAVLIQRLFVAAKSAYALDLLQPQQQGKLHCLARLSVADLDSILAQQEPLDLLNAVYDQHDQQLKQQQRENQMAPSEQHPCAKFELGHVQQDTSELHQQQQQQQHWQPSASDPWRLPPTESPWDHGVLDQQHDVGTTVIVCEEQWQIPAVFDGGLLQQQTGVADQHNPVVQEQGHLPGLDLTVECDSPDPAMVSDSDDLLRLLDQSQSFKAPELPHQRKQPSAGVVVRDHHSSGDMELRASHDADVGLDDSDVEDMLTMLVCH